MIPEEWFTLVWDGNIAAFSDGRAWQTHHKRGVMNKKLLESSNLNIVRSTMLGKSHFHRIMPSKYDIKFTGYVLHEDFHGTRPTLVLAKKK